MPRRLLRDGQIVDDDWAYAAYGTDDPQAALIVPFSRWQNERDLWLAGRRPRLGVLLSPEHKVASLAADLPRLDLIGLEFSGPAEGRGYSQARLLRERWNFGGELRAVGYVRKDQLFFMARCGCNSFELDDADFDGAQAALSAFSSAYQPSNDAGLPAKLWRG